MLMVYIPIALAAVVLILVVLVALQPADFRIERQATMSAAPVQVFAQVNDLHRWVAWSPWENIDPDLQRTYEAAPEGTGASYSWVGNKKVGEGE
jgi:hypothetical protein